ncbi:MAG: DNA-directed RNA polymerase subunit omega [Paludibacteraceae bacterium]|nr:DNA-directed RNA polymerase subunit omega [Paludibacteraceae bacterium]
MDYKKTKAPHTTVTRDMNSVEEEVGNVYETVAILGKRANQISSALKKELDAKLQDFSVPQDGIDEVFENKEQIEISKSYERLPKATLIATQELLDHQLIYHNGSRDAALKDRF